MSSEGGGQDRVLVVEDDPSMQRALTELLRRDGFAVHGVRTGGEAPDAVEQFVPDLVILDLGLPDMSGFDVLRALRATHQIPLVVLSGRADETDRVLALELGADDYVVKPFLNRELVARVRVRLRRPPANVDQAVSAAVTADGLVVDTGAREVTLDGAGIELTAKEFDLLAYLVQSPRQVFSRGQLLGAVWQSSAEWQTEATITEHVHRLRQKLGADRIVTIRGVGYRFDPQVSAQPTA